MPAQKELTPFQIKVYRALLDIPAGQTRTYKQIAQAIGDPKASRAVGNACNKNPYAPLVPCHRVVGSNGSLTGYAFGLQWKKKLLELESQNRSTGPTIAELEKKLKVKLASELPSELA